MTTQTQTPIDLVPFEGKFVDVVYKSGHCETGRLYYSNNLYWIERDTRHGMQAHSCPADWLDSIHETGEPLPHRVAVYVPGTNGSDLADNSEQVSLVARLLAHYFGGSTTIDGCGNWINDAGNLVSEPVKIVYAFTKTLTHADITNVRSLAAEIRDTLAQDCVAIEIDTELSFV